MNQRKPNTYQSSFSVSILALWVCSLFGLSNCQNLEPATEQTRISTDEGLLIGKKNWKTCQIKWELITANTAVYSKPTAAAFDVFGKAGIFLTFVNQSPADISVSFATAAQLGKTYSPGLLQYEQPTLAIINQTTTGQYKIVLNQEYKWTEAQFQYVVMHQVATILGISPNQSTTQRYLLNSPSMTLSDNDLAELRSMYPASGLPTPKSGQATLPSMAKVPVIEATITNFLAVPYVLSLGHCWSSKSQTPTLNDNEGYSGDGLTQSGQANNDITVSSLYNLKSGTKYYIRAYARNNCGVGYSDVITYTRP